MCVAEGSGACEATAGKKVRFTLYAVDEFRNRLYVGGHKFDIEGYLEFLPPEVEDDVLLDMDMTGKDDGTYLVEYDGERAEKYVIEVSLDGQVIPEIHLNPEIKPCITDKSCCTISKDFSFSATAGIVTAVNLQDRD